MFPYRTPTLNAWTADNSARRSLPASRRPICSAAGSGRNQHVQINRGGNRRLNRALHLITRTRLSVDHGRSKALIDQHTARGKTPRQGLRALKPYIAREPYRTPQSSAA